MNGWPAGTTCDECGCVLPQFTIDATGLCDDCLADLRDSVIAGQAALRGEFDETSWDDVAGHVDQVVAEVKQLEAMLGKDDES